MKFLRRTSMRIESDAAQRGGNRQVVRLMPTMHEGRA
jgi:hypothetical protein